MDPGATNAAGDSAVLVACQQPESFDQEPFWDEFFGHYCASRPQEIPSLLNKPNSSDAASERSEKPLSHNGDIIEIVGGPPTREATSQGVPGKISRKNSHRSETERVDGAETQRRQATKQQEETTHPDLICAEGRDQASDSQAAAGTHSSRTAPNGEMHANYLPSTETENSVDPFPDNHGEHRSSENQQTPPDTDQPSARTASESLSGTGTRERETNGRDEDSALTSGQCGYKGPSTGNHRESAEQPGADLVALDVEALDNEYEQMSIEAEVLRDELKRVKEENARVEKKLAMKFSTTGDFPVYRAQTGDPRLTTQQYFAMLRTLEATKEEKERISALTEEKMQQENQKLATHQEKVEECRTAFRDFLRKVAKNSQMARSGKPIPESILGQLMQLEEEKTRALQEARSASTKLKHQLDVLHQMVSENDMQEQFHVMDFEQLKIENQALNEKIVERNEEIKKLRSIIMSAVQLERLQARHAYLTSLKTSGSTQPAKAK
ncbi:putative ankyrin repeat protein [Toxoplasma gondii p89]|uniref:Putative ankyrin repeat protein n=1 Tax=Toxoplasma gondii p89 TaxID=943119 RepID=A0A086JAW4_TOXGO|nr:putative ankyrin repeat protein [Toxoplasma gondii p89]